MRRFFIPPEQLENQKPQIQHQDAHHIRSVLRLKPKDAIIVFDGAGNEYEAMIEKITEQSVQITLLRQYSSQTDASIKITLAQGFLKDKKMDRLVRMLTELGVTDWRPFIAGRSVATPDEKRLKSRHQRWEKISLEAAKQCRRSTTMKINATTNFADALTVALDHELKLIFWEGQDGSDLSELTQSQHPNSVFIMIGPEGGFEHQEYQAAIQQGFHATNMGPRILRAETAAVAACTMVQYAFGDMGALFR